MTTLTTADIEYVRMMTGDTCETYDVSDDMMQWLYDNKVSGAPLCMSGDSLGGLIVWVLRARVRKATKLFDETNAEGINKTVSQKYTHLKEQLVEAERGCGMDGGLVTIGSFDLGLDTESDSEYASYGSPSWWGVWGL
jgi:hypothetical protein